MKEFKHFLAKNKLLTVVVAYLVVVLVALPLTLLNVQQPTHPNSNASAATTLSFSPASVQVASGATVPVDIMVDPGTNAVSFITLDINYDPSKLSAPANSLVINNSAFDTVIEGPVYESGRVRVKVSIGATPTKAISSVTKVGTITFTALADTGGSPTQITHGNASYVLSVAPGDNATDNVLATTQPASITIGQGTGPTTTTAPSATTVPTGVGGDITSVPTFQPTNVPTNAVTPTPICTPLPAECAAEGANCTAPANGFCTEEPTPTAPNGPTPTDIPIACQKVQPADVVIALDASGSMRGAKMANAKASAQSFVKILQKDANNRVALVTFSKNANVDVSLTSDLAKVDTAIGGITIKDRTCIRCAMEAADNELATSGRTNAKKVIVLLTDGRANTGGPSGTDKQIGAEQAALNVVKTSKVQGLLVYTIGIGNDVNPGFLQQLGQSGAYYFAATPIEINSQFINVYTSLNNAICSGQPIIPSITLQVTPNGTTDGSGAINTVSIIMLTLLLIPVLMLLGHMFL